MPETKPTMDKGNATIKTDSQKPEDNPACSGNQLCQYYISLKNQCKKWWERIQGIIDKTK